MELAGDHCYEALRARDARFDGRFFVGVRTTGVFCRPICPAPMPRRRNVTFFACAAAAEGAGFRPCLRCRPERAPGTPAWNGTSATVARALRLIDSGVADEAGVEALAHRVGVGTRHLRRLFQRHLGVGPHAIVRAERLHSARRLLDETDLSMSEIAWTAGFRSVRQFNHAMRQVFGNSPSALRAKRGTVPADTPSLRLRLTYRPPLDWDAMLAYLASRATPGVDAVDGDVYRRTIRHEGGAGVVTLEHDPDRHAVVLAVPADAGWRVPGLVARARRLLDLNADPHEIAAHLAGDRRLARLVRRHGVPRLPGAWDPFEIAVRAVLGQQVSVAAATTLMGRTAEAYGEPIDTGDPTLTRLFPTPAALRSADAGVVRVPGTRAAALIAIATAIDEGNLAVDGSCPPDETIEHLLALPGIGPWTAEYVALRALGEPDAFPSGDLGLQRAWGNGSGRATAQDLESAAERWRPWRGYAAMLLWKEGVPA